MLMGSEAWGPETRMNLGALQVADHRWNNDLCTRAIIKNFKDKDSKPLLPSHNTS
jgi:hypothetical protein